MSQYHAPMENLQAIRQTPGLCLYPGTLTNRCGTTQPLYIFVVKFYNTLAMDNIVTQGITMRR